MPYPTRAAAIHGHHEALRRRIAIAAEGSDEQAKRVSRLANEIQGVREDLSDHLQHLDAEALAHLKTALSALAERARRDRVVLGELSAACGNLTNAIARIQGQR